MVPLFNEEQRFDSVYWLEDARTTSFDLHFVDDGSSDATPEIVSNFCRAYGFRLTELETNVGKANALREGLIRTASGPNGAPIGFVDADAVFPPEDIDHLRALMDRQGLRPFQAFFSSRVALSGRDIRRRTSRHYIGRAVATILSSAYRPMPYDSQSGLKFFRQSDALIEILQTPFLTRWFFEMELLIRWKRMSKGNAMPVWEEPVQSWFDAPGSKISGRQLLLVMRDLNSVIRQARRSPSDAN